MTREEKNFFAILSAVEGVGRATLFGVQKACRELHLSVSEVWNGSTQVWEKVGLKPAQIAALQLLKRQYTPSEYEEYLKKSNITLIFSDQVQYPYLLKQIPDLPFLLFVKGNHTLLTQDTMPSVAVVGTRKITGYGEFVTHKITTELVENGAKIISGFMFGVDMAAHQAALKAKGQTIGVLGFGFHAFAPTYYFQQALEFWDRGGVLISEFAPDTPAKKGHFVIRNRIIAGLSQAVVVAEAAARSGSLITARYAGDYGRTVCTVPAAITSSFFEGTKELINQGATMISSGEEVLQEIGLFSLSEKPSMTDRNITIGATPEKKLASSDKILLQLKAQALNTEQLVSHLQLSANEVCSLLTELELKNQIKKSGQRWFLKSI
jgi:DNA processing protein